MEKRKNEKGKLKEEIKETGMGQKKKNTRSVERKENENRN
jgi:hypothetical protein